MISPGMTRTKDKTADRNSNIELVTTTTVQLKRFRDKADALGKALFVPAACCMVVRAKAITVISMIHLTHPED